MEEFDKINETFNTDRSSKWPPWHFFKFVLIFMWSVFIMVYINNGITKIHDEGLDTVIVKLWKGNK